MRDNLLTLLKPFLPSTQALIGGMINHGLRTREEIVNVVKATNDDQILMRWAFNHLPTKTADYLLGLTKGEKFDQNDDDFKFLLKANWIFVKEGEPTMKLGILNFLNLLRAKSGD